MKVLLLAILCPSACLKIICCEMHRHNCWVAHNCMIYVIDRYHNLQPTRTQWMSSTSFVLHLVEDCIWQRYFQQDNVIFKDVIMDFLYWGKNFENKTKGKSLAWPITISLVCISMQFNSGRIDFAAFRSSDIMFFELERTK